MTYDRNYYLKNKESHNKRSRQWQLNNPEKFREILKKSRSKDDRRRLFNAAKNRSKNKKLDFNLSIEDIIIPTQCPYLNTKFIYGDYNKSMSIDRINPNLGYVKGNTEVISTKANRMKNTATKDELILFASNIIKRYSDI